jgi:hypothetical protein
MFWDDGVRSARWKICAPKSTLQTILWYLHDTKTAGHLGIKKNFWESKNVIIFFGKICKSRLSAMLINVKYVESAKTDLKRNVTL